MAFGFSSVGHFFASFFHDLHVGSQKVEAAIAKVDTPQNQAVVEGLTSLVDPQATTAERIAFGLLGTAAQAVNGVDAAGIANGVNIQLDQQASAEIQQLISATGAGVKAAALSLK